MPSRPRLLLACLIASTALPHAVHADAPRLVLTWQRNDKTDPLSGNVTVQAFASIDAPTGETAQATATCDDGFISSLAGADESIEFDFFQGQNPADLGGTSDSVDIEYKWDNGDTQTSSITKKFNNGFNLRVGYDDMSSSQKFAIEVPLANGDTLLLEVNPTDPVMRAFTDVCKAQYDKDNPPSTSHT